MNLSLAARLHPLCASMLLCISATLAAPAQAWQQFAELDESSRRFAAYADEAAAEESEFLAPQDEIALLRKRIETLEKAEQKRFDADAKKKADEAAKAEEWIDTSAEKWNVRLGGHVQMEYITWASAPPQIPAQDYFEFRRLRLVADGV